MNVKVSTREGYEVAFVEGRIDTSNAAEFELKIIKMIEGGSVKIILDCAGLNYISSAGLRVLLVIQKRILADKGKFRICSLQPGIREIFDISGFTAIFSVYADQESAIKG